MSQSCGVTHAECGTCETCATATLCTWESEPACDERAMSIWSTLGTDPRTGVGQFFVSLFLRLGLAADVLTERLM